MNNSTIANNTTRFYAHGGGTSLKYDSTATIINSTISGNSAVSGAGGIHLNSQGGCYTNSIELIQVTLTNNFTLEKGGAIYVDGTDQLTVKQSLITGKLAGIAVDEIVKGGTFISNGYNLLGLNGYSSSVLINLDSSDEVIIESNLSDVLNQMLVDNGESTPTHALNPNGPTVDFVSLLEFNSLIDQTGKTRPIGSGCDVCAVVYTDVIF